MPFSSSFVCVSTVVGEYCCKHHLHCFSNLIRSVTTNPRVHLDLVPYLASEELIDGNAEFSSFLLVVSHQTITILDIYGISPFRSHNAVSMPANALMNTGPLR